MIQKETLKEVMIEMTVDVSGKKIEVIPVWKWLIK